MFAAIPIIILHWSQGAVSAYVSTQSISPNTWNAFNRTLGGRLKTSEPVAAPCFSIVDGHPSNVDASACAAVEAGYTNPTFLSPQFGAYMFPEWGSCMRTSESCLLDDTSPTNPIAFTNVTCSQGSVPFYHVDVASKEDVVKAFTFANATGVQLSIKNSGHDYKGRSSMRGSLSLWTRNLQNTSYDAAFVPEGGEESFPAITVGAGVDWETVYTFAEANNVTAVGGYHRTVGASGGWVMAGGHSVLSPVFGLGIDRVLQFRIVTPDGIYRVANAYTNSDLFWALRGGGGSTFGVVLESTLRVEPQKIKLQVASVSYNATSTNVLPYLRLIVDNTLKWGNEGWGGHLFVNNFVAATPLLSLSEAQQSMKPVTDYILSQNGTVVIEELPSWFDFFEKYVLKVEAAVGSEEIIGTRLVPGTHFESSEGKDQIYNALTTILTRVPHFGILMTTPFLFNYTEGTTSATPAWRGALWHFSVESQWEFNATKEEKQATFELVTNTTQIMRDLTPGSGAYFNEGDVYEPNHEESFWGPNYHRLLSIKQKYDPWHLLDCWQCVGWRGAEDARYSCYLEQSLS